MKRKFRTPCLNFIIITPNESNKPCFAETKCITRCKLYTAFLLLYFCGGLTFFSRTIKSFTLLISIPTNFSILFSDTITAIASSIAHRVHAVMAAAATTLTRTLHDNIHFPIMRIRLAHNFVIFIRLCDSHLNSSLTFSINIISEIMKKSKYLITCFL